MKQFENTPTVVIIGQPNVGKSTIFNKICRSRKAIVSNVAGVTRDRNYAKVIIEQKEIFIVDTGGLVQENELMQTKLNEQTKKAINEGDLIVFVVDAKFGLSTNCKEIAKYIHKIDKNFIFVANKSESQNAKNNTDEFYELGLGKALEISAAHNEGLAQLKELIINAFPKNNIAVENKISENISFALIGKPNTGKSTLVNQILGKEQVITSEIAGTTRDSIAIDIMIDKNNYTIIDTAGVRRKTKIKHEIEKFSVIRSLNTISQSDVIVYLVDPQDNITDQDIKLINFIIDEGKPLIIAINKIDSITNQEQKESISLVKEKLNFASFATITTISAKKGIGIKRLFKIINIAYNATNTEFNSAKLNSLLEQAITINPPPLVNGRRIKLQFAHPGGTKPPKIIIHGRQTEKIPESYKRYLLKYFYKKLKISSTPIHMFFKTSKNPFVKK